MASAQTGDLSSYCNQLTSQFSTVQAAIASLTEQSNALSGLTDTASVTQLAVLTDRISANQSQLDKISGALSTFCSALGTPSASGASSVPSSGASSSNSYNTYYDSTTDTTDVQQVAVVPQGGVNTGDGSF